MKRFLIILTSILILSACSPAIPVPTATTLPPTAVPTMAHTPTSEPSATPEPTKVPMPEGWAAIAETREIGGRQVVFSDKGEAATEVDGVFYPVDARGCFYKEFFDPELQKNDPKVMELVEKINNESSFIFRDDDTVFPRNIGSTRVGSMFLEDFPRYYENVSDAILLDQRLCFNGQTGEWEHVLDYVMPYDAKLMPKNTIIMRAVVGWLREGRYDSITHLQEAIKLEGESPNLSGQASQKADTLAEALTLWQSLIDSKEQISVSLPRYVAVDKQGGISDSAFESALKKLIDEIPAKRPSTWKDMNDPEFFIWATQYRNQLKYFSQTTGQIQKLFVTNAREVWRYMGEHVASGELPEPVIRVITKQKK